jgi:hypothetical protein
LDEEVNRSCNAKGKQDAALIEKRAPIIWHVYIFYVARFTQSNANEINNLMTKSMTGALAGADSNNNQ